MKKILCLVVLAMVILTAATSALAEKYIVVTEKDRLNIRLESDHSQIIGKLNHHQVFEPKYVKGGWAHIDVNGKHGIAHMSYLMKYSDYQKAQGKTSSTGGSGSSSKPSSTKPTSSKPISECEKYVVATASGLRLRVRSAASFDSTIMTHLSNGSTVYVIKTSGSWSKIYYDKTHVGYVWAGCIKKAS